MIMQSAKRSIACLLLLAGPVLGEAYLARDGKPMAEIVLSPAPARTGRLAAQELQRYVEKISGARLPIADKPTGSLPLVVYVGQSPYTEKLGITAEGLRYGAYRIVSGEGWVVFIGDDTDFVPIEPWPRGYGDIRGGKMQREWDGITGAHWGYPHSQLHKHYTGPRHLFGTPQEQKIGRASCRERV